MKPAFVDAANILLIATFSCKGFVLGLEYEDISYILLHCVLQSAISQSSEPSMSSASAEGPGTLAELLAIDQCPFAAQHNPSNRSNQSNPAIFLAPPAEPRVLSFVLAHSAPWAASSMVEQWPFKPLVQGSSPWPPTSQFVTVSAVPRNGVPRRSPARAGRKRADVP